MENKTPISEQERLEILAGSLQGIRDSLDEIICNIDDSFDDIKDTDPKTGDKIEIDLEEKIEILLEAMNSTRENIDALISFADDVCIDIDPR